MYQVARDAWFGLFARRAEETMRPTPLPSAMRLEGPPSGMLQRAFSYASDSVGLTALGDEARADLRVPPAPLPREPDPVERIVLRATEDPNGALAAIAHPATAGHLRTIAAENAAPLARTLSSPAFAEAPREKRAGLLLSHCGVGPGKVAQMLASDDALPAGIRESLAVLRSSAAPSRTIAQAQRFVDDVYGAERYRIDRLAGVGTIGEAYHATSQSTGAAVVVKTLKTNVNAATLDAEERIARRAIRLSYPDARAQAYQLRRVSDLYAQWRGELDFAEEARNAARLADGATRFTVARVLEIGRDPQSPRAVSLVLERAAGVSLDELSRMLATWKTDRAAYAQTHAATIAAHPWCARPQTWARDVPSLYRDVANEQTLRRFTSCGESVSHGDPHPGNLFIDRDEATGKLKATLIDTGLVVRRTPAKAITHLGIVLNSMVGNARQVADGVLDLSENDFSATKKAAVRDAIAARLNERLFGPRVNLTDGRYNNRLIDALMQEMRLHVPAADVTFVKAQFQVMMVYLELSAVVGALSNNYLTDSLTDIAAGAAYLAYLEPRLALQKLGPALTHLAADGRDSLRRVAQFVLHTPEAV